MKKIIKRIVISLLIILPLGFAGISAYAIATQNITKLIVCSQDACISPAHEFASWYLLHFRGNAEDLDDLDKSSGLSFVIRDEKLLRFFIEKGAPVNKLNYHGYTPLHAAVVGNFPGSVKLLLESGADPTIKDKDGRTPLELGRLMKNDLTPYQAMKALEEFKPAGIK